MPLTSPYGRATLHTADCREVLFDMADNSVDSIVVDPPYALESVVKRFGGENAAPAKHGTDGLFARASAGFMGATWDTGEVAFSPAFWNECLRVLKPGGHLVAFGGTRTYHRLASAIEDGGFEVRDMLAWLYGSGFPKNHDQGDGRGTALKPGQEPICLARKPFRGSVKANLEKWGVGALYIEASRVPSGESTRRTNSAEMGYHGGNTAASYETGSDSGRYPANVLHDGSDEVLEAFPVTSGAKAKVKGTEPSGATNGVYNAMARVESDDPRLDPGSAARFFYCAKASRSDREEGLDDLPEQAPTHGAEGHSQGLKVSNSKRPKRNIHPTVKPTSLMEWACRLVTPPGGVVLDPFMGSGSTGKAAMLQGFAFIGIEMSPEFMEIASRRVFKAELDTLDLYLDGEDILNSDAAARALDQSVYLDTDGY